MLHKLKIKLVLINIISLTVVLLFAFLSVYFLLETRLKRQEHELLEQVAAEEIITVPDFIDDENIDNDMPEVNRKQALYSTLSIFYVKKDTEDIIIEISPNILNEDAIRHLVRKADSFGTDEDEIDLNNGEVQFAFFIKENPNGKIYVFIDILNRVETMELFIYFAAFSWAASMICVVLISMFLASKAIKPVKESIEKQDKFISDASHELRTPIAVIRTNTELIMDSPEMTVEENMKWLTYIHTEAKRVAKMTEDMLDLSRRTNIAQKEKTKQKVDLSELSEDIFGSFRQLLKEHDLDGESEIFPGIFIHADEYGIRQMLTILLDNAIKYTNEGSIKLKLEKDSKNIYIKIIDTGVGISQENTDKIFERFFRADKSRTKNTGGSGLGLSIANVIAKEHNGKIAVKSELGKGSEFCVTLPISAEVDNK